MLYKNKRFVAEAFMNPREILQHIDNGANHFLLTLADAPHMTRRDAHGMTLIQPQPGQEGVSFVCQLALNGRDPAASQELIQQAKATGLPIWFPLLSTDEQFAAHFGRERIHGAPLSEDDEVYMAMLPGEMQACPGHHTAVQANTPAAFADCAHVANTVLAGGRPDLHPVHHAPLMEAGRIRCYVLYADGQPVSAATTMEQNSIVSLELVATLPKYRHQGYAETVCHLAVQDAWDSGARLVTVRAVNLTASRLYERLGFRAYNYAL